MKRAPRRPTAGASGQFPRGKHKAKHADYDKLAAVFRTSLQQNGRLELFQLLYGNRRIFLEEAGSAPAGVSARLGDYGGLAKGGRAPRSRAERDRPGIRELPAGAARRRKAAEELSI